MRSRRYLFFGCCLLAGFGVGGLAAGSGEVRGLPFIRTYSLDEIGSISRGMRLGFDSFGRFAVMYDGAYSVLNDSAWVDRIDTSADNRTLMTTIRVIDGKYYYAGRGSWGLVEQTPEGRLRARPLVPADVPAWTTVTAFNDLVGTRSGVYFYELNGVVYWDFAKQRNYFFELPRVVTCFRVGERMFVSCQDRNLREFLPETESIRTVVVAGLEGAIVERAVKLDESRALLALQDGRLVVFDGDTIAHWAAQKQYGLDGQVTAMTHLVEDGVALCLSGKGLFLVSADGSLRWALPLAEFQRISSMVTNEPGVLWAAGENGVYKVFYNSPLTSFGRSLGLTVSWPELAQWDGGVVVGSSGVLYEMEPVPSGAPSRFRPAAGVWERRVTKVAARGPHLLVGDAVGVMAAQADGTFAQILRLENVAAIEFIEPDLCLAVGSREIAALRHVDGQWRECAPRIAGVGDAPVHTLVRTAVWMEMGGDRVGRLTFRDGRLALERIALPWSGGQWTNLGAVGSIVVLSGAAGNRAFYDETRGTLTDAPRLAALLDRSPYWISRLREDETGTIWATYAKGVMTFTPAGDDYVLDATTFELRNDSYPNIKVLPGNNVWIVTGRLLYHVEPKPAGERIRPATMLVSLVAEQQNLEILNRGGRSISAPQFSFDDNSLSFRFFSGTYAWGAPPLYQYRLGAAEAWTSLDPGLVLRFPKMRDGAYRLEVRRGGPRVDDSPPFAFGFVINPPWYRTPLSYAVYGLGLLLSLLGAARWINHRSLERNTVLEKLVHQRTKELERTMEKLGEETRNAATLAERSRLAGEIHDSVQQGLTGTLLHLETTMANPVVPTEVHTQLNVMRNMLSYSREEVQQAVWNLESPLLQNSSLPEALDKLAAYVNAGSINVKVVTHAEPAELDTFVRHNLLRIAQEALTNAAKHAQAGHIGVTLQSHAGSVNLSVTDDGKGFDPAVCSRIEGHFGLRGLQARAKAINAHLQIISSPGAGTSVVVTVQQRPSSTHEPLLENKPA